MSANVETATIAIHRGDHFRALFTAKLYPAETPTIGEPLDLTGHTCVFTAKRRRDDAVPAILINSSPGITIQPQAGATLGKFALRFATATTASLEPGAYEFDLYVIGPSPDNDRYPVLVGQLLIKKPIGTV